MVTIHIDDIITGSDDEERSKLEDGLMHEFAISNLWPMKNRVYK